MTYISAPTLIQYAGDDQLARPRRGIHPLTMFELGYDTLDIAEHLGISEADALKSINKLRSRRRGLDCPYKGRSE